MATIFTRILNGELPGTFVYKDDVVFAIMTIAPIRPGHTLLIPRQEIDHWIDMPPEVSAHMMRVGSFLGEAIQQAFPCRKVGISVIGLEVPHVHFHLIPIDDIVDMDFSKQDRNTPPEAIAAAGERIRKALADLGHA